MLQVRGRATGLYPDLRLPISVSYITCPDELKRTRHCSVSHKMCGRYALGAAHIQFLQGLQGQYARLFGNRGPNLDEEEDDDRGVLRLRGGGEGGEAVDAEKLPCDCDIKWERERDFWSRYGFAGCSDTSYNIAPRQRAPVIRRNEATGDAMIETMYVCDGPADRRQWGLVPHWTKYPPTGPMNTINARSEALM